MSKRLLTLTAAILCAGTTSIAQPSQAPAKPAAQPSAPSAQSTLQVGDKAPPLSIAEWVKGEPITGFEKGKVYIVEFWATWCDPCIKGMPHLSELQRQYKSKGVTVIGVTAKDPNNSIEGVKAMVAEKGDTMGYTVAWDNERQTNTAYMKAANQNGIPCSFLVDQNGVVAFIGHPMWLDKPLADVVAGTWDIKAGNAAIDEAETKLSSVYRLAPSDPKGALKAFEELEATYPKVMEGMADFKFQMALASGDYDAAYRSGAKIVDKAIAAKDAQTLNAIAWTIVDPAGDVEKKDLDLALKAANKSNEFTGYKDPAILDTVARVHFEKGDLKKAIEFQTKAVDNAPSDQKPMLEATLKEYQAKQAGEPR